MKCTLRLLCVLKLTSLNDPTCARRPKATGMRAKVLNYGEKKSQRDARVRAAIHSRARHECATAERAGLKWRMSFLSLSDHDDARIEQRLTPICIVRRSRSLPDSDATDHAADLNDFLSSRSGEKEEFANASFVFILRNSIWSAGDPVFTLCVWQFFSLQLYRFLWKNTLF